MKRRLSFFVILAIGTLPQIASAAMIAAGFNHTCAIRAGDHKVVCWGNNDQGQLDVPDELNNVTQAIDLASGAFHTCAVRKDNNHVICWGGKRGTEVPSDLKEVSAISAG